MAHGFEVREARYSWTRDSIRAWGPNRRRSTVKGYLVGPKIAMAIKDGYNKRAMDVSIAEARNRLTQLIRAVEAGESVVITRNGVPVAQIAPPPPERRKV